MLRNPVHQEAFGYFPNLRESEKNPAMPTREHFPPHTSIQEVKHFIPIASEIFENRLINTTHKGIFLNRFAIIANKGANIF